MKKTLLFAIVAMMLSSLTGAAVAGTYNGYFSQSGSDTGGDGSMGDPWKTLSKAKTQIDAADSSDTVNLYFKRGDTWTANTAAINKINCHGLLVSATNPIVNIDAYGSGNRPIFDGLVANFATTPASNTTTGPLFYNRFFEFNRNSCSISNIEIKRVYGHGIFLNPSNYFTLDSSYIHHFGAGGISTSSLTGGNNITVTKNVFHTGQELWRYSKRSGWEAAIQLISKNYICEDNIVRYNVVYDIYGEGIQCSNSLCEYNVVGDTYSIAINNAPHNWDSKTTTIRYNFVIASNRTSGYPGSTGIRIMDENPGGSNANADAQIYGNIVVNKDFGIRIVSPEDPGNPFGSVKVYNNTVIDSHKYNMYVAHPEEFSSIQIYNNSFVLYDQTSATHVLDYHDFLPHPNWTIDNNHFWTTGGSPTVDDGWTTNCVIADPDLPGEPSIDWDGQSGPTYFSDIDFDTHLYPPVDSALVSTGKTLGVGYSNIFLTSGTDFSVLPETVDFVLAYQSDGGWDIGAIVNSDGEPDTDINNDGEVNLEDFAVLSVWWDDENVCSSPGWCGGSDFDMSGTVDMFDLTYFAENWLR